MSWFNGEIQLPGESPVSFDINGKLEAVPQYGQEIAQTRGNSACLESTLDHVGDIVNTNVGNSSRNKRRKLNPKSGKGRKLTSDVWDHFEKYQDKEGNDRARCNHCQKDFDGSSTNGTTHLRNHLKSCPSSKNKDGEGDNQADRGKGNLTSPVVHQDKFVINQELNQLGVVRGIIKYGFWNINSIKPDILRVYHQEKEKLHKCFKKLSCRFSLAIKKDKGTYFMVLYFIDDNWELKQKVVGFHTGIHDFSSQTLKQLLLEWNVDKNTCSLIIDVDNDDDDDDDDEDEEEKVVKDTSSWVARRSSLPFGGHSFGASFIKALLSFWIYGVTFSYYSQINDSLIYVCRESNRHNFQMAVEIAKCNGRRVTSRFLPNSVDVFDNFDGLESLEMAIGFKEAFYELEQIDSNFKAINITEEEWDNAEAMYGFLKEYNDAARSFLAIKSPTANAVFPKICDIYSKLLLRKRSVNPRVSAIASSASARFFDKCWYNSKLFLAIVIFVDPRFKKDIIERWYRIIYGVDADGHLREIFDNVENLYKEYAKGNNKMLDEMGMPCTPANYSEIELYLKEPKIPLVEEFDILNWWQSNTSRYPILARMARDFLAIPISPAVPDVSNSLLDTDFEDILKNDSLDEELKGALVCTRIWLMSENN